MVFMMMCIPTKRVSTMCLLKISYRKRRWLELLKDYEMIVLYHHHKANVVADALSRMIMGTVSHVVEAKKDIVKNVQWLAKLGVRLEYSTNGGFMVHHNSKSSLVVEVKSKQHLDKPLMD